jgi:hypothetical protein
LAVTDRRELNSFEFSMLSVEVLDEVLAGASFSIVRDDDLLKRLLSLGDEYRTLLRRIEIRFLGSAGLATLVEDFVFPPECTSCSIFDHLRIGDSSRMRLQNRQPRHLRSIWRFLRNGSDATFPIA